MDKKRILVTGSNGFLGHKLTELILKNTNYELCCTSASVNRNPQNEGYKFQQLNLIDLEGLGRLIDEFQPTHIIHSAALSSVEVCENDPVLCKAINVDSATFLAQRCKEQDIHLTFLSTDFVFDGQHGPYKEEDACSPVNAYGQSKLDAEQEICASGCSAAILRTILVYGVIADKKRSNLVLWAKNKLEAGEAIKAVSDQWRMPTWVDDLATACLLAVEKNAEGIYHISSDTLFSVKEVVEQVADYWNLDRSLVGSVTAAEIGQATNRPRKTGFVLDKAKAELGYNPTPLCATFERIEQQIKELEKQNER